MVKGFSFSFKRLKLFSIFRLLSVIVPWLRDPFLNPVLFLLVAVKILLLSLFLLYAMIKIIKGLVLVVNA